MPSALPVPISPTWLFWVAAFTAMIKSTIGEIGDTIGWEEDNTVVGPRAFWAKQRLLDFLPYMLPTGPYEPFLYRPVLDHGDFGFHNMNIAIDATGRPFITSLFDWEDGLIVPAILSDPMLCIPVETTFDANRGTVISQIEAVRPELREVDSWHATTYSQVSPLLLDPSLSNPSRHQKAESDRYFW